MDSKTRVLNALNGKSIDRLPMWYGAEPALTEKIARHLMCRVRKRCCRRWIRNTTAG